MFGMLLLSVAAPLLQLLQRLVDAALRTRPVVLLSELLVVMATPAPEPSWGPLAVDLVLAKRFQL